MFPRVKMSADEEIHCGVLALLSQLFFFTDVFDMTKVEEVIRIIPIGLIAAVFLLNTSRFVKAIESYNGFFFLIWGFRLPLSFNKVLKLHKCLDSIRIYSIIHSIHKASRMKNGNNSNTISQL